MYTCTNQQSSCDATHYRTVNMYLMALRLCWVGALSSQVSIRDSGGSVSPLQCTRAQWGSTDGGREEREGTSRSSRHETEKSIEKALIHVHNI